MRFNKKNMWQKVVGLTVVAGLAITLSGCSSTSSTGSSTDGAAAASGTGTLEGKDALLKIFMPSTSNVYLAAAAKAAEAEAKTLGFTTSIVENNWDQTEQDQQVQEWIASGETAAAVLLWPVSAANATATIRSLSAVAPVLQWNQLIDPAAKSFIKIGYAGVSDLGIGDQAGKDTLAQIDKLTKAGYTFHGPGGLPNVLEIQLGSGDYSAGVDRDTAFQAIVKGKINFLGVEGAKDFDAQGGYTAASTAIPKYLSQGIDIIYVQTNDMGNGVVQAAEQNGLKPGTDVFLMTGTSSGSMANLKAGKITTAVLQSPVIEGTLIVDTAAQYLATGKSVDGTVTVPSDKAKPELAMTPPSNVTFMMNPTVTADNLGSFKIWGSDFFALMGAAAGE
ncbi:MULTISPECIES: sugar ABC transporter substrate-binding protein [unclassified Cryobacterium]|uniref:sugar ABC transporter substrate-binding protein n=1 Tax=unclassified Cryobacterium TaxID=2649013 RepID=UPI002AB3F315|nr:MULTISPECIES: substrate-binding domain-containing protein [unclassified Cryobacterium]MDY7526589.1 substrate-binding domain-containing protein [Cryobacterium sp. 10C2]MDY7557603.1 substrate-binding domain-containing protein [Cryobacterium sp. 10C3]MEB0290555.1 substrate-binding domain-containing protein [Cryobacterium sp. 10C2]